MTDRDENIYCLAADHTVLLAVHHMLSSVISVDIKEAIRAVNAAEKAVYAKLNRVCGEKG